MERLHNNNNVVLEEWGAFCTSGGIFGHTLPQCICMLTKVGNIQYMLVRYEHHCSFIRARDDVLICDSIVYAFMITNTT